MHLSLILNLSLLFAAIWLNRFLKIFLYDEKKAIEIEIISGSSFLSKIIPKIMIVNDSTNDINYEAFDYLKTIHQDDHHDGYSSYDSNEMHLPICDEILSRIEFRFLHPWQQWYCQIRNDSLYMEGDVLDNLLIDLQTQPIIGVKELIEGTQFKMILKFANTAFGGKSRGLFKPYRMVTRQDSHPYLFQWEEIESGVGEILSFHLDRALDFRRIPPCIGRKINLQSIEALAETQDPDLWKTIYISPIGNLCVIGNCDRYCKGELPICGDPIFIEGSVCAWLPSENEDDEIPVETIRSEIIHPWVLPWSKAKPNFTINWTENPDEYCNAVKNSSLYSKHILGIIDLGLFDFLIDNRDRHHFEMFEFFLNKSMGTQVLIMDNGKGFGVWNYDTDKLLAPLTQCCMIRSKTLKSFLKFTNGHEKITLGEQIERQLKEEPGNIDYSFLPRGIFTSLNRRLFKILTEVSNCIEKLGYDKVVYD